MPKKKKETPYLLLNKNGKANGLLICDHAGKKIPAAYKNFGLQQKDIEKHIGWDIGAADVTRALSRMLDMPALLGVYSRLLVDLNRAKNHPEFIPAVSDGISIPGNRALSKVEKKDRLKKYFDPYQDKIDQEINRLARRDLQNPLLIAVHSLTPVLGGRRRPWDISILWNKNRALAFKIIAALERQNPGIKIGRNKPYTLKDRRFKGSTIHRHGHQRDIPYVFVEFRQDLIDTPKKAEKWAKVLFWAFSEAVNN